MRFVVLSFGPSPLSGIVLAPPETGTLVVDGAVHPEGFDGAAAALSGFSLVDVASLDDVLDALPSVGTFEVRPAEVT
jgi:hypothetical protein